MNNDMLTDESLYLYYANTLRLDSHIAVFFAEFLWHFVVFLPLHYNQMLIKSEI